jgi:hypothetical protein
VSLFLAWSESFLAWYSCAHLPHSACRGGGGGGGSSSSSSSSNNNRRDQCFAPSRRTGVRRPSMASTNPLNGSQDEAPPTRMPAQAAADCGRAKSPPPVAAMSAVSALSKSTGPGPPTDSRNPPTPPPLQCERSSRIRVQSDPRGTSNLCPASAVDECSNLRNLRAPADFLLLAGKLCATAASSKEVAAPGGVAMPVPIRGRALSHQTHSALESSRTPATRAPRSRLFGVATPGAMAKGRAKRRCATHRQRALTRKGQQGGKQNGDDSDEPATRPTPPQCPASRLCFRCKMLEREVCIVPCGHFGLCADCGKDVSKKRRGKKWGGEKGNSNEGRVRACPVCEEEMVRPWVMDPGDWVALGGGFKCADGDPIAEPRCR